MSTNNSWTHHPSLSPPANVPPPSPPMIPAQPTRLYDVTLRSGTISLLAPDSESAAWMALELSFERDDELIDVRQADEW